MSDESLGKELVQLMKKVLDAGFDEEQISLFNDLLSLTERATSRSNKTAEKALEIAEKASILSDKLVISTVQVSNIEVNKNARIH